MTYPITISLLITSVVGILTLIINKLIKKLHKSKCFGKDIIELDFSDETCSQCGQSIKK